MKASLFFLIFFLFCSCNTTRWSAPFRPAYRYGGKTGVVTEAGKFVPASEVRIGSAGVIADDTVRYRTAEVASFANGPYNFKKINYRSFLGKFSFFAQQTDSGRINRFTTTKTYYYNHDLHWIQQMRNTNYIQNGVNAPAVVMNYRNLKNVIPLEHPAYLLLDDYKNSGGFQLHSGLPVMH